ncbi:hypothetical protein L3Q82_007576 [Scortum barcoo]|uniref:Uncharacterized protein n=1 Tax=Scortum barcoo TaxID=214431 RepID=A0ACB8WP18_9TELE|nr:hypothetical protein L3Q82_007576 [Scortum barcoo]
MFVRVPAMSNPVGSLSEGTLYGSRMGMTEDSLAVLGRCRDSGEPWDLGDTKPGVEALERGIPGLYLSCFDMLLTEDATWLVKVSEASPTLAVPMTRMETQEEPEQCPVIDSQEQGLSPGLEGQEEERSLEQVQSMVVGEVLKDIETACKLLNITPGRLPSPHLLLPSVIVERDPIEWNTANVQKWLLWTEHLYRLPHAGKAFQDLTGKDLCAMSEEEFRQRSPQCGDTLHAHLDIWKSGIFKIEDSAHVARLWGLRKNRPAMNYDKLSRSIRQYYKKGIIRKPDVSQRLVYQFVHPRQILFLLSCAALVAAFSVCASKRTPSPSTGVVFTDTRSYQE